MITMPSEDHDSVCLLCKSTAFTSLYEVTDTNQGTPGRWEILSCDQCHLGVLSPFPKPQEVAGFYSDQFYTESGQRFRGWMEWLRAGLASLRGRSLNRLAQKRGRLLDFGSGSGHFARAQSAQGWEVVALDPYSGAASESSSFELVDDWVKLKYPDASFDAVTLWYVVEHLSNPRAMVREFKRVLKPGGILVLAQQDFESVQARVFGPRWLFLDPPRHLWQFSAKTLGALVEQEGFVVSQVDRSSIEMGPFTILQSALNSIVGNQNYLFKFLKSSSLRKDWRSAWWPTLASLILAVPLGLASLVAYFLLLAGKSGDVFTLYCRSKEDVS
ncbi:class I SAM-dependent methyltransferase [Tardiphaga sp. 866_E4_N2_1]|uniref:class I SAM-dependent methyltransferase n=1 Tax=unclassified Tardiphaga TaxID=2631404 RepID=UPI003F2899A8